MAKDTSKISEDTKKKKREELDVRNASKFCVVVQRHEGKRKATYT